MKTNLGIDLRLLLPVFIMVLISLSTLFAINISFFKTQLISLFISIGAYIFFSKINVSLLKQFTLPIYIISVLLLIILLVIGLETRGAVRWVDLFGIRLQFSETLKPFLALGLAVVIAESKSSLSKLFFLIFIYLSPIAALIYLQPDLGTALIYVFVTIFTLLTIGFPILWFVLLSLPFILLAPFGWTLLHEYQRQRVLTFFTPSNDPLGTSYNAVQAIIAVGSGSFWGKGLSEGTQSVLRFLPERHTDFIFATIAEGLGFVGASIVIVAFLLLLFRIYVIFLDSKDLFSKAFLAASFGLFFIQGFVNIAMNVGFVPIVGVTLPFVSYGGNSLLSNFIFLGIITAISNSQKHKQVLEIK